VVYVYIGIGGIIGSLARYGLGVFCNMWWGGGFPIGTLAANLLGSFILGWFTSRIVPLKRVPGQLKTAVSTGVIGSFTTFSTFSVEIVDMLERYNYTVAFFYTGLSVAGGLLFVLAGHQLGAFLLAGKHSAGEKA
jgi:fluoride exporter